MTETEAILVCVILFLVFIALLLTILYNSSENSLKELKKEYGIDE